MATSDDTASAKSRAEELRHFEEVVRNLHALKKLHRTLVFEALGSEEGDNPEHVRQWRKWLKEQDDCIRDLERWGTSRKDLENYADKIRKQADEDSSRELQQLAGNQPSATTEASQEARTNKPIELTKREQAIDADASAAEQRALINSFISKVEREKGYKPTRTDIWTAAGYKDATEFERFQRNDERTTTAATLAFRRVLEMDPKDFIERLEKKRKPQAN